MILSKRLETILSLAPRGLVAADIGTDHALVASELVRRGISPYVIATDLRKGPLEAAEKMIRKAELEDKISLRQGDGLGPLAPGEAQLIILAGMGGALMRHILEEGREKAKAAGMMILSPQSELPEFRSFLQEEGYAIEKERLIPEAGKYYQILLVLPGMKQSLSLIERHYGKNLEARDRAVLKDFLKKEIIKINNVTEQLRLSQNDNNKRQKELKEKLALAEEALRCISREETGERKETV